MISSRDRFSKAVIATCLRELAPDMRVLQALRAKKHLPARKDRHSRFFQEEEERITCMRKRLQPFAMDLRSKSKVVR